MNFLKGFICLALFVGALYGALWPILRDGEVNWLLDMDVQGGVQITYRADFKALAPEQQNVEVKRRLMELSHMRLDARLANFQGAEVKVQKLGEDRLLVEVPGVRDIAQVKADLGKPKVVSFTHVVSISPTQDNQHHYAWQVPQIGSLWLKVAKPVPVGGHILYDQMQITREPSTQNQFAENASRYQLSLPLDMEGQGKMMKLTSLAYDKPAQIHVKGEAANLPLIALFLDDEFHDAILVKSRAIRQGVISVPSEADASLMKKLLSSGPMPIKFDVYSERSISPLIGAALRDKGIVALIVSLVLLIIFMGICYLDRPWFIFVYALTLAFWFLCIVALANLQLFRISLLQLAGFVLLIGMNTDSLVLVFEDLRESFKGEHIFGMSIKDAFKIEWMVIFWGMVTTIVVIAPLFFQGGVFSDYIWLMILGMGVNVLGYLFARVLMSLPIAEELSRIKITVNSLADRFSRFNLMRFRYQPIGAGLVLLSLLAIFVYPGIPLAPVFSGGKALEVEFNQPVPENAVQQKLAGLVGKGAEIMTEESEGMVKWALVKFPAKVNLQEQEVMNALAAIGAEPKLMSIQTISRTLVTKTRMQISAEMFLGFALLIVLAIVIYNMKAGFYIIVSLLHDVIICLGVMALFRISLDLVSIAALVTMAGYSINDSIVILHKLKQEKNDIMPSQAYSELGRQTLKSLCAENIRNVTARVFITALTTALPMLIMALMAGSVFVDYGIIIFTGIFFGSLSSIYIVGRVLPTGFIKW